MHVYDKGKYHYKAEGFPEGAPYSYATLHIAWMLGYLVEKGMVSELVLNEQDKIQSFKKGELLPTELLDYYDNVLTDDMLTEEGNEFMRGYYMENKHLSDLTKVIGEGFYETPDSFAGYRQFVRVLEGQSKKSIFSKIFGK